MATPENTLITRAEVTSVVTPATNRFALVMDGQTIELGNTGRRDVSGLLVSGLVDSGRVLLHRVGNVVTWYLTNVILDASATGSIVELLLSTQPGIAAMRPGAGTTAVVPVANSAASANTRVAVDANGTLEIHFPQPGVAYTTTLTYIAAGGWPPVLPGVVDGDPIGV